MHDIADLEGRGLIGVGIATTEFIKAAQAQSRSLGYHPAMVFIPHPVQDRTDAELHALADGAFARIMQSITAQA